MFKTDQPQHFKDVLIRAIEGSIEFQEMAKDEPYRNWNTQATLNFLGGKSLKIKKVEITRISRADK